jgi:periplasmic divalent cation tolerance protein
VIVLERIMVTVACGSVDEARKIARALVAQRLAACAQIVPGLESVYRWQGKVETANEVLLLVKTTEACWDRLVTLVSALHAYEIPEILAVPVVRGLAEYCDWMDEQLAE